MRHRSKDMQSIYQCVPHVALKRCHLLVPAAPDDVSGIDASKIHVADGCLAQGVVGALLQALHMYLSRLLIVWTPMLVFWNLQNAKQMYDVSVNHQHNRFRNEKSYGTHPGR